MKLVLLDAETLGSDLKLENLERFGELEVYRRTSAEETAERIRNAEIVITNKVVLDRETIMLAPRLKLICIAATGMNNVDLDAAAGIGISVKNVAGYSTESVVQHTFAMLFALIEQISYYDRYTKSGEWSKSGLFTHLGRPFPVISGKQWGVVGLGSIGAKVAEVAEVFGCRVRYFSTRGTPHSDRYTHVDLENLLEESDIVSIHAPLDSHTEKLIGGRELARMKDGAVLLNLGRGGIVEEAALAAELDRRRLYACLDVTEKEPIPESSPLLKLKNPQRLLITPHIAWTGREAREKLLDGIIKNIEEFMQ